MIGTQPFSDQSLKGISDVKQYARPKTGIQTTKKDIQGILRDYYNNSKESQNSKSGANHIICNDYTSYSSYKAQRRKLQGILAKQSANGKKKRGNSNNAAKGLQGGLNDSKDSILNIMVKPIDIRVSRRQKQTAMTTTTQAKPASPADSVANIKPAQKRYINI